MMAFSNIYFVWIIGLHMYTNNIIAQVISIQNKTEPIGCGAHQNVNHTRSYYLVLPNSEVRFSSCNPDQKSFLTYWAVLQDLCNKGPTTSFFATVDKNGTPKCSKIPDLIVNETSCENDYIVTNDSLMIKNISYSMKEDYICYYGENRGKVNLTFAVSYSIEISRDTTEATSSNTIISTDAAAPSTTKNSGSPSDRSTLIIVLSVVSSVLFVGILGAVGFFCYRRRRHGCKERSNDYSFDQVDSKTDSSLYGQYDAGHSTKLDTDAGYAVWRPVMQRDIF
ncbi:unnamed protein product [Adineta ricciae]|uniref:Uncharacterized protein n=1 Tax=Adineta ricciae TaxID=249248 RepID=A0A813P3V1_ADIRI|nr:unnamed protein product [Adineta ricciae]